LKVAAFISAMKELDDKKRELRRARQQVSERLRHYYAALKAKYEQETDALMERVAKLLNKY
jgi:predicted transcriptional regulator